MFMGYRSELQAQPPTCSSEIRRVMDSRNSEYIRECGGIFISHHGINNIREKEDIYRIYRKLNN